jgi:hypothetical protein
VAVGDSDEPARVDQGACTRQSRAEHHDHDAGDDRDTPPAPVSFGGPGRLRGLVVRSVRRHGRRRRGLRLVRPVVRQHVEDDHGDVVDSPRPVGGDHQPVRGLLRSLLRGLEDRLDLVLRQHPREPVGAQEEAIAVEEPDVLLVERDVGLRPERSDQDVAMRVDVGFRRRDLPRFHHPVHQRVVVRQLPQGTRPEQVRARVAHVHQVREVALDHGGREGGPHAREVPVGSRAFEDRSVRRLDLIGERHGSLPERFGDRRERQLRCDLATAMPAHPVRYGVHRRLEQVRVLVARSDLPDVGRDPGLDPHRASSTIVVPTRIRSPAVSIAGAASRCSFTKVPFVEPRSSTYHEPFLANILACSCDT